MVPEVFMPNVSLAIYSSNTSDEAAHPALFKRISLKLINKFICILSFRDIEFYNLQLI